MSIERCKKCNTFHAENLECLKPKEAIIIKEDSTVITETTERVDLDPIETRKDLEMGTTEQLIELREIINDIIAERKKK